MPKRSLLLLLLIMTTILATSCGSPKQSLSPLQAVLQRQSQALLQKDPILLRSTLAPTIRVSIHFKGDPPVGQSKTYHRDEFVQEGMSMDYVKVSHAAPEEIAKGVLKAYSIVETPYFRTTAEAEYLFILNEKNQWVIYQMVLREYVTEYL